jgi:hypothetical protein
MLDEFFALDDAAAALIHNSAMSGVLHVDTDPEGWDKIMTEEEIVEFLKPGVSE